MDRQQLVTRLGVEFDGSERAAHTVARQAGDLRDSGRLAADAGYELTADRVVDSLTDAPDAYTLVRRWNWWVGSLGLAYGDGYRRFRVRPDIE